MEPTYDYNRVLNLAEPVSGGDGKWKRTLITLGEGETAMIPGTSKRLVDGPARLQYDIHPSGILLKHV